jgi:ubiquinone/menaquinone biosynthesis C-methylase UbiE
VARYAAAGARVTGIDLTPRHVELAEAHLASAGLDARVVAGDAERLPFDDRSFDLTSSNGVLHHTPDILAALREMRRVLRPGGMTTVIVYNRSSLHYWCNQVLYEGVWRRRLLSEGSMDAVLSGGVEYSSISARPLVRVYRPRELRALLRDAGFADVTTVVRHFQPSDAFPVAALARWFPRLRDPRVHEWIGRRLGWYVVARGVRR